MPRQFLAWPFVGPNSEPPGAVVFGKVDPDRQVPASAALKLDLESELGAFAIQIVRMIGDVFATQAAEPRRRVTHA